MMPKSSSSFCICSSNVKFSGGYLAKPTTDVIEISLKFERINHKSNTNNNSINNATMDTSNSNANCKLNFIELSDKTLKNVYENAHVDNCVKNLLRQALEPEMSKPNTSHLETPAVGITNVIVHQPTPEPDNDYHFIKKPSFKQASMKSSKSMETVSDKILNLAKKKSPDEDYTKAKSFNDVNKDDEDDGGEEYIENGESIELIFISDEFVNKVQQKESIIVLNDKENKRRESLTGSKKIVIITDEYKKKVLKNNTIVVKDEKRMMIKKSKKLAAVAKTYNTNSNSYLTYEEPEESFGALESKRFH